MRAGIRAINLGVRFLLELGALAAAGYWGATIHAGAAARAGAAVALPLLVAAFWGTFVSPKAPLPTGRVGRAGLGLVVFLAAAALLNGRGFASLAAAFAAVAVVSSVLLYALPQ